MLIPNGRFSLPFTCVDATGLPTAPTGTPTAVLVKNGTDLGTTVTVTMSTANGVAICTIPSDAVADDRFHLRISAVISAVTYVIAGPSDSVQGLQALVSAYDPAKTAAPTAAAITAAVRADQATELGRLDVAVGTRLATSGYTAPPSIAALATGASLTALQADATAIKAKTDNLPTSPAATGAAMTLTPTERTTLAGSLEAELLNDATGGAFLAGIQSSIQAILDSNADVPVATIAAAVAAAVRTNLQTELDRLDATISSRLAANGYTAPPSIAALATSAEIGELTTQLQSLPAAAEIAASILLDPTKKLLTNDEGFVTSTNDGGGTNNTSTFVMPLRSTSTERVLPNRIDLFVRERVPLTISIYDDKQHPVDCSGLVCTLSVSGGIEIPHLLPQPSAPGQVPHRYVFTPPAALTAHAATLWFGLRVTGDTQRVLAFGHVVVAELP